MKRILFVLRGYHPYDSSSGTNVAGVITEYLAKNYAVDVFTMLYYAGENGIDRYEYNGVRILLNRGEASTADDVSQKIDVLMTIVREEHYDLIISVCYPIMAHVCAAKLAKEFRIPWIAYYVDPFFSHHQFPRDKMAERAVAELGWLREARAIIVPPQMAYEYETVGFFGNSRGYVLEFPLLDDFSQVQKKGTIRTDERYTNIIYAGNLYVDIRNPEYLLRLFERIGDRSIRLYLVGDKVGFDGDYFERWKERIGPENLIMIGRLEEDEVNALYEQADILIIGFVRDVQ